MNARHARRSPGVFLSLILGALWLLSWPAGLWIAPDIRWAGISLLTWWHIFLGVLGIAFSLMAIRLLERWESS